jgi:nucleoid DNA-binding protein
MKVTIQEHKDFLVEEDENEIVDPVDEVQDEAEDDKKESSESVEEQVKRLAKELELEVDDDMIEQLVIGMDVEQEHGSLLGDTTNITKDDEMMTFKIALAHVMEIPDYYDRLLAMEAEAEEMKESKENKEWSEDVDTSWTPPKGLFTKSATEIANVLVDNSKDLKQAMSRLMFYQNRAGGKVETKELGKFNRVQNLLRAAYAKKTESVVPVEEKIKSKFESGDYYFSLRSKEPGELRNLERKLRSAKGIVVQSIHPPTNTIIVKVAGANHKIARQLVRTVVDKMNVTVEGRKRVVM